MMREIMARHFYSHIFTSQLDKDMASYLFIFRSLSISPS